MTRIGRTNGMVLTAFLLVILVALACSKGYNKYADEYKDTAERQRRLSAS